jgi:hypothetical protein
VQLWVAISIIAFGSLTVAALLTVGLRRLFPGRDHLVSNHGGSPALRAITATYALLIAFVLATSLQAFNAAQQQTVAEGDAVASLGNLARTLPAPTSRQMLNDLTCYASSVVNVEFPAMRAGDTSQLDDDSALLKLYQTATTLPSAPSPRDTIVTTAITTQLSTLTSSRASRIRAAKTSLPLLVWLVIAFGAAVVILAVGAVTYVDRAWPQFAMIVGVTAVILSIILLIVSLEQPFRSEAIRVNSGSMSAALVSVSRGLPSPRC